MPHATTGVAPCQLLMQRELKTRFSLLRPDTERSVVEKQCQQKASVACHTRPREFSEGDRVMVRDYRSGTNWIPAVVVEILGPMTYIVETDTGQRWKRHLDQIKNWIPRAVVDSTPESMDKSSDAGFDLPESPVDTPDTDSPTVTPEAPESSDDNGGPPPDETDEHNSAASEPEVDTTPTEGTDSVVPGRRYPARIRRPPNYF